MGRLRGELQPARYGHAPVRLALCLANIRNGGRRLRHKNQIAIDSKIPRGQLKPVSAEKRCFTLDEIEAMVSRP
jgi:hypothetical protein